MHSSQGESLSSALSWWQLLAWGVVLLLLGAHLASKHDWMGDSPEYLVSLHSFSSHLSPEVRASDLAAAVATMNADEAPGQAGRLSYWLREGQPIGSAGTTIAHGLLHTADGERYFWHFWLYPALAAVIFTLGKPLGLSAANAFLFLNLIVASLPLAYAARLWRAPRSSRHFLMLSFLLCGTTFYLWWPHPEVLTASLLLLGLMLATDERYCGSLLAIAIAAIQNPPIFFCCRSSACSLTAARCIRAMPTGRSCRCSSRSSLRAATCVAKCARC
jgi:hypothetical protein